MSTRSIRQIVKVMKSGRHIFACLSIALMLFLITDSYTMAQQAPVRPARPPFPMGNRVVSPEILPDNRVTFRIEAKQASEVAISGEWMGMGASEKMTKNDAGMWSITLSLAPEFYGYTFKVDGVTVLDPSNAQINRDGSRSSSVLLVPGKESELYAINKVPHGTLSKVWYDSPTLGLTRRMYVYTPPGYESSTERYPVLYLLHGGGGDEDAWTTLGRANYILDNLIAQGKAKPMLVIMTNGNPGQAAAPGSAPVVERVQTPPSQGGIGEMASGKFEESIVKDVIPFIEGHYRVLTGRENRALSGLSMGGMQTMTTTQNYPGMFDYIGVMSMGLVDRNAMGLKGNDNLDAKLDALRDSGFKLYWVGVGKDDFGYEGVTNLRKKLDEHNFKYVYRETTGGHTWANWRIYLSEVATLFFK